MNLKIEHINGNVDVTRVHSVAIEVNEKHINIVDCIEYDTETIELEPISRVTVDGDVIYDYMGRKERFKVYEHGVMLLKNECEHLMKSDEVTRIAGVTFDGEFIKVITNQCIDCGMIFERRTGELK